MSDWEIRKLDEQYGRVEDLRNERRAENARIFESHGTIKPEFRSHSGRTIADLMQMVQDVENRDLCAMCMGYGEIAQDHPLYGYEIVTCPTCGGKS